MPVDPARAKSLFLEASDLPSPAARNAFLDRECGGDAELQARVEALLAVEDRAGPVPNVDATVALEPSPAETLAGTQIGASETPTDPDPTAATGVLDQIPTLDVRTSGFVPGRVVAGRYTLRDVLGEGGLGTVYLAEQTEPVKRQVALKLIKLGMDSRAVLARFNAERQALALMDHPNIARVYDGGTTDTGQPFFVMELVNGLPITDYCDRKRLPVKARLELFVAVCQAVQHAHQKGIIHRDLKPSNVMVTEVDGRPTPKVIDFGVAKATNFNLTEQSLGDTGAIVGTPTYMSPEQADPSTMDIDTRTDVYALGVILYELLAGSPPLDASQFKRGALLEMLRMVREVDPPRPSTKVSTAEGLPSIAAGRSVDPAQLKRALAGDLDWIVMKALEKDRTRRYETANGFAADIHRHLTNEPVLAAPPSRTYRTRKFVRKHRGPVIAASFVLLALAAGLIGTAWGLFRAERARQAEATQRARAEEREEQAIEAVKKFGDAVANNPDLKNSPALESLRKTLLKEPLAFFKSLRGRLQADKDTRPESLARLALASYELGVLTHEIGDMQDALTATQETVTIERKLAEANPGSIRFQRELASSQENLGILLGETGKPGEALKAHESALAIRQRLADANPAETGFQFDVARSQNSLGIRLIEIGKPGEALKAFESALAIDQKLADANPTSTEFQHELARSHLHLGNVLKATGREVEALKAYELALAIRQKLADGNPENTRFQEALALVYSNIGVMLGETGRPDEALKAHESALKIRRKLADAYPTSTEFQKVLANSHASIANVMRLRGKPDEALKLYESALMIWQRLADANPTVAEFRSELAGTHHNLGLMLRNMGKLDEALKHYELARPIRERLARELPEFPDHLHLLGGLLNDMALIDMRAMRLEAARSQLQQAVVWQKKALASNPRNPNYRQFLGNHLFNLIQVARTLGDSETLAEAEREFAKLRESGPALGTLEAQLSAILHRDQAERLSLAQKAYDKALHAMAARLWSEAIAADPKIGDDRQVQHRYNAACAAALAGCGQGKDDPSPDDAAKAKLRQQALDWLKAELVVWSKIVESGPQAKPFMVQTLKHWREDTDLAGIRDEKELAKLSEAERKQWQSLWADVDSLLQGASPAKP